MSDVLYIVITVGFFAVCVGFIRGCDALVDRDEPDDLDASGSEERDLEEYSVDRDVDLEAASR